MPLSFPMSACQIVSEEWRWRFCVCVIVSCLLERMRVSWELEKLSVGFEKLRETAMCYVLCVVCIMYTCVAFARLQALYFQISIFTSFLIQSDQVFDRIWFHPNIIWLGWHTFPNIVFNPILTLFISNRINSGRVESNILPISNYKYTI